MSATANIPLAVLALFAGTTFVIQQSVNANLRYEIGSAWWAGFISYLGGTLVMLMMALVTREPVSAFALTSRVSWWSWTGGLFGAIYIGISIMLLPRLGIFWMVILIVIGQLITSLVFEHYGMLNVPLNTISTTRIIGVLLLIAGAVLIRS